MLARFVIPTPFAAYAFDPIEGWIMSLPIYAYSFIWPMSDVGQLVVFFMTNIWTFLLRTFLSPPFRKAVCILILIPVLQTTTAISSTRCITRASNSTLGSFPTCGTGWGGPMRTLTLFSILSVNSERWWNRGIWAKDVYRVRKPRGLPDSGPVGFSNIPP
jgi:hypothetical protein